MTNIYQQNVAIWDQVLDTLVAQLRTSRERRASESIGLDIDQLSEAALAEVLGHTDHLDWWSTGFHVPRQSGATRWVSSKLSPTTMVVTQGKESRQGLLESATQPYQMFRFNEVHPPTTSYKAEELEGAVVDWDHMVSLFGGDRDPEYGDTLIAEAVRRVERIYVWHLYSRPVNVNTLANISKWSRSGGKVPEIIVLT